MLDEIEVVKAEGSAEVSEQLKKKEQEAESLRLQLDQAQAREMRVSDLAGGESPAEELQKRMEEMASDHEF